MSYSMQLHCITLVFQSLQIENDLKQTAQLEAIVLFASCCTPFLLVN